MTTTLRHWPAAHGAADAYLLALAQFDGAARRLGLDDAAARLLRIPTRESQFTIPVRTAEGDVRLVPALLVQQTEACGPPMADVRLGGDGSADLARARALWLTWTAAVAGLPASGAAGWIGAAPGTLTRDEQEQACRGWVRQSNGHFRAELDAVDGDHAAWQHTAWMRDEYRALCGGPAPRGGVSFTPTLRHAEAVARGLVGTLQLTRHGALVAGDVGLSVSIQGTRPLAALVARRVAEVGGIVKALAWAVDDGGPGTIERPFGVTVNELSSVSDGSGRVDARRAARLGYTLLPADAWLTQAVDVIVLTGDDRRLRPADVERIDGRVRLVVEGTYGLLDPAVEDRLAARGITVVPDLLTGVGRLVAHDVPGHVHTVGTPRQDALDEAVDAAVVGAAAPVLEAARRTRRPLRDVAYDLALTRVRDACQLGGWL
jgi:glutamate dehydrogenase